MGEDAPAFQDQVAAHNELMAKLPIDRDALLGSLDQLHETASRGIAAGTIQIGEVAVTLSGAFDQALEAQVRPPLTRGQRTTLVGKSEMLKLILAGEPDQTPPAPTDPAAISTDKRKGA